MKQKNIGIENVLRFTKYFVITTIFLSLIYYHSTKNQLAGNLFDVNMIILLPLLLLISLNYDLYKSLFLSFKNKNSVYYKSEVRKLTIFDNFYCMFFSVYIIIISIIMFNANRLEFPLTLIILKSEHQLLIYSASLSLFAVGITTLFSLIIGVFLRVVAKIGKIPKKS